jgi:hypothetical protein
VLRRFGLDWILTDCKSLDFGLRWFESNRPQISSNHLENLKKEHSFNAANLIKIFICNLIMNQRPSIPAQLKRAILVEAGHRCAIPTCQKYPVDIHHIVPYEKCQEHVFDNLIALCCICHERYHRYKDIDQKSLEIYKANLGLLSNRYGEIERRVLQYFCDQPKSTKIRLSGLSEILVLYLLKDGFLLKTSEGPHINGSPSWEEYMLTETGRRFVDNWKQAHSLE